MSPAAAGPNLSSEQVGALAAIILDIADETGTATIARSRIRCEWTSEFPEYIDAVKPVHGGGHALDAPRARRHLQNTISKLVRAGLIRRIGDNHVQIIERAQLERLALAEVDPG